MSISKLVLTRRIGESITVGDDIEIELLSINRCQIRLMIKAPREIDVHRKEIYDRIQDEKNNV